MTSRTRAPLRLAVATVWRQRSVRERRLMGLAALVLGGVLLWQWAVAPALATWRMAPQRQAELDAQTRHMLQLQAEARQLSTPARLPRAAAMASIEASATAWLGQGVQVQTQGERVRVVFAAASASGLRQWLVQAREQAQALPEAARLEQATAQGPSPDVRWRGELTLRLH